jgi:hypothetical protein
MMSLVLAIGFITVVVLIFKKTHQKNQTSIAVFGKGHTQLQSTPPRTSAGVR